MCLRAESISPETPLTMFDEMLSYPELLISFRFANSLSIFFFRKFRYVKLWSILLYIAFKICF